ncbi:NAD(+) diphosphatase [Neisseriaceae bacterium TC5R-5]|nr:NAD(+) diphosphatase [Neisseriaceae bacterium TC5R-5]
MSFDLPPQFDPALPTYWCIFERQHLLLLDRQLPSQQAADWSLSQRLFLGVHSGRNVFLAELVGDLPAMGEWVPLRAALLSLPPEHISLVARAAQVRQFQRTHRFCGRCAFPLSQRAHDHGKCCDSCGQLYYPKLSPAMMVVIYRGRELLLARSPHFAPGVYSALAGFVETGETLEQCVHREVAEEVGIKVNNLRYICSQSWPFPHSLMLGFTAEYESGEICLQPDEIEDAAWFDIDAMPLIPTPISIAYRLLNHTRDWLSGRV